ncbi:MAG: glutamate--tRNA ligase [Clostridiales Family XIII bacterium]|nr:glutamate--tRNA ligase [Clostridiales Family XIII bacterium]
MAELLFSGSWASGGQGDPSYFEKKYPPRALPEGAAVTRLGPSPTGFIHLGNLYTAFMNEKLSNETGGVFFLRIEDTDSKREVEGAVESLIASLAHFGVSFDEGVALADAGGKGSGTALANATTPDATTPGANPLDAGGIITENGAYGPYYQSARTEIYHAYARQLVLKGLAYPCFLTEDEIARMREGQEAAKEMPGVYGGYALYRGISPEGARERIENGEPYVLRLNADAANALAAEAGDAEPYINVDDGIRGRLSMPRNMMDVVVLKSDGIPTYHFAHVVDDHLMRTTHVIRGEEWMPSLPIHIALFGALGFEPPTYCHSTVLMKLDGGKKRKLSKRKDPELSLEYYRAEGYHPKAILEYLLTVINSNFEEWRAENPDAPIADFNMTTEKMGVSGILFDLDKLSDVSKDVLVRIPAAELSDFMLGWASEYNSAAHAAMSADPAMLARILDIGRGGAKPRKDLAYAKQIWGFISYFYDDFFEVAGDLPERVPSSDIAHIIEGYLQGYDHADDRDLWFGKIRELAEDLGYAAKPKDYKKEPDRYKGHVGDVSAVLRIALTGRAESPDLYEIQQILGEVRVRERMANLSKIPA